MAIAFPQEWETLGGEGLVVEFVATDGSVWVGNFRPGLGGIDDVRWHPNEREVLVTSAGALWCVTPERRSAEEIAPAIFDVWPMGEPEGLVFNDQGLAFALLGRTGVVWHSRRISWDGFDKLRFEAGRLIGDAWSPVDDRWLPFSVDLKTGQVEGGSYDGPEMHFDYLQAEREPRGASFPVTVANRPPELGSANARLSPLPCAVIRANARYFAEQGHEPQEIVSSVEAWLAGAEDAAVQEKVIGWLRADARWLELVAPALRRRYWYLWPVAAFVLWHMRRRIRHWAGSLADGSSG